MKDASWKDCIESNSVKYSTPDNERANSLIETAMDRIDLVNQINEKKLQFCI